MNESERSNIYVRTDVGVNYNALRSLIEPECPDLKALLPLIAANRQINPQTFLGTTYAELLIYYYEMHEMLAAIVAETHDG